MIETPTRPSDTPTEPGQAGGWWRLSDEELAAALIEQESVLRRAHAHAVELLGEALRRGPGCLPYPGPAGFLHHELHLSKHAIRERISQAEATQPGRGLTGESRPAPLAATGQALAGARIGPEHAAVICRIFARCPTGVTAEERAGLEATLLELAATASPEAVHTAGRRAIAYWTADSTPPAETDADHAEPRRLLRYRRKRNGELEFSGTLDPETGSTLEGLLGPLAKPRPATDGAPDPRSGEQRQGDALAEIVELAARSDELTVQGGERAVLTVTVSLAELEARTRPAVLGVPDFASVDQLRRLACEARVVPVIYNAEGHPLYLGRSTRHATQAQRRALAVRDRGCAWPGCDRGPKWCVAHHILMWTSGGPTDIDLLVLLCAAHHRMIHHNTGWEVRLNPHDKLPEFLPPARLDPERRPLRNTAHDIVSTVARARRQTSARAWAQTPPRRPQPCEANPWQHAHGTARTTPRTTPACPT